MTALRQLHIDAANDKDQGTSSVFRTVWDDRNPGRFKKPRIAPWGAGVSRSRRSTVTGRRAPATATSSFISSKSRLEVANLSLRFAIELDIACNNQIRGDLLKTRSEVVFPTPRSLIHARNGGLARQSDQRELPELVSAMIPLRGQVRPVTS